MTYSSLCVVSLILAATTLFKFENKLQIQLGLSLVILLIVSTMFLRCSSSSQARREGFFYDTINPTCKGGYYLDKATGTCQCSSLPAVECPTNFNFGVIDANGQSNGRCTASSVCSDGYSFNQTAGICDLVNAQIPATCPAGTTYDQKTGKCITAGQCPPNYTMQNLDAGIQGQRYLCVAAAGMLNKDPVCPEGSTLSADKRTCVRAIECATGFKSSPDGKCCLPDPNPYGATCGA
jgi:hypothetical protein